MYALIQRLPGRRDEKCIEPDRTYNCCNCKKYEEGASFSHVVASLLSFESDGGDASVPSPPNTTPAPTRSGMDRFLLCGHQHMMPPRSITIPPSQTRGTSGLTKTRMVASEGPFQLARNT